MFNVVNFVAFQCAWLITVLGAAAGMPLLGILFSTVWLILHLTALRHGQQHEIGLIVISAVLGFTVDSVLVLAGLVSFPDLAQLGGPASLWMTALWMNLAATLRHSLAWLASHDVASVIFGLIGGPLAYFAGERIGAIQLTHDRASLLAVGVVWALAFPMLMRLAHVAPGISTARLPGRERHP